MPIVTLRREKLVVDELQLQDARLEPNRDERENAEQRRASPAARVSHLGRVASLMDRARR
jgi:hypothetical protein